VLLPNKLRGIVREAIERHIPAGYMDALNEAEESGPGATGEGNPD